MLKTKGDSIIFGGSWTYKSGLRIFVRAPEVPFLIPFFAKSAHLYVPKNGTLGAQTKN